MRLLMTRKGLKLFGDNPLFGAGIGRFATTEAVVEPPPTYRHIYSGRAAPYKSAHNSYVGVLGETGLAGTLPFGFLVVLLAIAGLWASYRDARIGAYDTLAIYTAFIGMSVHFGSIMGITSTMPWIVYGMLAGSITGPAAKRTAY
jgi:O-antigen ligase